MLKQGRKVEGNLPTYENNCMFYQIYKINGEYEVLNVNGIMIGLTNENDEVIINSSSYRRDWHDVSVISGEFKGCNHLVLDNYAVDNMFLMVRD